MNKNKAIQLLERLQDPEPYEPMLTKDAYDAIQMAIDALSADGDTISRKAAIDVIDSFNVFESRSDQIKLEQMIGELPPAQPERTPMQELLDVTADRDYWKAQCHSYEMTINRLTESTQPERIKGRWIEAESQCGIKCSNCGYPVDDFCHSIDYIDLDYAPNFCPNCGADMREVTT